MNVFKEYALLVIEIVTAMFCLLRMRLYFVPWKTKPLILLILFCYEYCYYTVLKTGCTVMSFYIVFSSAFLATFQPMKGDRKYLAILFSIASKLGFDVDLIRSEIDPVIFALLEHPVIK